MFTLDQLRYASAVAKARSFRKAAALLGVDQAKLSRAISRLEDNTGIQIFERDRKRAVLVTPMGRHLLEVTAELLETARHVEAQVRDLNGGAADLLRVGVGPVPAHTWVGAALTAFSQQVPACAVGVTEMQWWELLDALKEERFDIIIGESSEAERHHEIEIEPLPHRPVSFMVRPTHPLAGKPSVSMADIANYPNVGPRFPARFFPRVQAKSPMGALSSDGRFFIPKIECSDLRMMLEVAAGSDAVCGTMNRFAADAVRKGLLVELPFHPPWLRTHYGIMHLRGRPLPSAAATFCKIAIRQEEQFFASTA
jgi:DNA-binding transcriptional LysR family regulator